MFYMQMALKEAVKDHPRTWKNPKVGAVIVKDDQILARGHHEIFGGPHAEVNAINHLADEESAQGATMYVTLEPCSHTGKTPPCAKMIVETGITTVVIGEVDPNPLVSGKGIEYLESHHVKVIVLNTPLAANDAYRFYFRNHRPLITLKYAMTADGRINFSNGQRSRLTGQEAFNDNQDLRQNTQAILVGMNTLKIDDPELTVRNGAIFSLIRIVVTHNVDEIKFSNKLFQTATKESPVWVMANQDPQKTVPENVKIIVKSGWTAANISEYLADVGIQSLLVEGGSQVLNQFVAEKQFNRIVTYVTPLLFGNQALPVLTGIGLQEPLKLSLASVETLANDVKLVFERSN
ncbi:bifunctional diaminohydroxyphosphoribosylaminopyrimidine deaminase/5-amino-6-(5-phosphoribosylamino)uracil reductase RibD [Lentilactobacillus sp. SPB1-3]|uniref:Bifunctional diaminohydroxyphosphoribosylaminopyrimidine deaminase/5-amino-6-(5-phosphoribosylamino)uracil reductase RibD n=1 Tax=Lentilactobacillus terminaliae TaxID=3003483 RepID=A0ACD5DGY4_9LACO|nr:bifunctional diaminohydroxyphosphoribosylaminopyrimidine deaminase/5-amino-6-(5-phosphoribosylamino)uracil reductase RibD [Lentilactobacillus sp. SPB1-3]MCZ0976403.1 bifunctional diaminohydroxyphosphoribosylaminopyrimidine deaminase/5-amino-6-(5-phosphoribosylamino)uracil reductase RibD [Lentilactobacillus sp. SPB1-3]